MLNSRALREIGIFVRRFGSSGSLTWLGPEFMREGRTEFAGLVVSLTHSISCVFGSKYGECCRRGLFENPVRVIAVFPHRVAEGADEGALGAVPRR